VRFNIETKLSPFERDVTPGPDTFVSALLEVITRERMRSRVTIQSFDWRTLKIVQQRAPDIPTVYLSAQQKFLDNINAGSREGSAWTAGLNISEFGGSVARMVKAAGGSIWAPYFGDLDPAKLEEARALGLKVVVWTVNQPRDIERMLDWKVDGIISDYPNRVREAMQKRGMAFPT
jgi:glycerophosphoryl diester phosphodiesterase